MKGNLMNINEINPHIRFARELNYLPAAFVLSASDYHFYYTLSDCEFELGGRLYKLKKNAIVFLPPGTPYRIKCKQKLRIISINFDYTQNHSHLTKEKPPVSIDNFQNSDITELTEFYDFSAFNAPLIREDMGHHLKDINAILSEFLYKKQFYREICSGYLKNILVKILRETQTEEIGTSGINEILEYIHKNYSEDIKNNTLAEISGYHSYHLNRLMKKATGTTLHQYLINYRIESAKQYLRETDFPILKISELCGYKNFSNFSHDFKTKTGVSPSGYRADFRNII